MDRESVVQHKLMGRLNRMPKVYARKIAQSMFSHSGIPDIVGCAGSMWFAIEVKKDNGKLTALQKREAQLIQEAGGLHLVCFGVKDIDYVVSMIEGCCSVISI